MRMTEGDIGLNDKQLIDALEARDGPMRKRESPHRLKGGGCPYVTLYLFRGKKCPWCEAQDKREGRPTPTLHAMTNRRVSAFYKNLFSDEPELWKVAEMMSRALSEGRYTENKS